MGFLDSIRERFSGGDDDYYDDYYDDAEGDGYYEEQPRERRGLLGNTPRPEAESVSVYTRSGRQLSGNGIPPQNTTQTYTPQTTYSPSTGYSTPAQANLRMNSGNLPPYVLRPMSYEDVQTVVRRVRTGQPVVLNFRNTNIDIAKRVLDFCYGLSFGIDGEIAELGDRVFAVLPHGLTLSQSDIDKLVADGEISR